MNAEFSQLTGWSQFVVVGLVIIIASVMIYWQQSEDEHRDSRWLGYSATALGLLGLSLSIFWAVQVAGLSFLSLLFCFGWGGMFVSRAVSLRTIQTFHEKQQYWLVGVSILTILLLYTALYASGLFFALTQSMEGVHTRIEQGKPAAALDSQIQAAQEKLASLSRYADADRAQEDRARAAQQVSTAEKQAQHIQEQLMQLTPPSMPKRLSKWMYTDCSPKHDSRGAPYRTRAEQSCPEWENIQATYQRKVNHLQSQLDALSPDQIVASYAQGHEQYKGVQQHLISLQKQRAELAANGQGDIQAWKAEDVFIADLFGIELTQANSLKWILFTLLFDLVSLLLHVLANQGPRRDDRAEAVNKFQRLVRAGIPVGDAIQAMGGGYSSDDAYVRAFNRPSSNPFRINPQPQGTKYRMTQKFYVTPPSEDSNSEGSNSEGSNSEGSILQQMMKKPQGTESSHTNQQDVYDDLNLEEDSGVGTKEDVFEDDDLELDEVPGVETKKEVEKEVKKDVDVESTKVKKGDGSVQCIKAFIQEAFMTGKVDENTPKKAIAQYVRDGGHSMRQTKLTKVITEVQDQWKTQQ